VGPHPLSHPEAAQGDGRPLHSRRPHEAAASTISATSVQITIRLTARTLDQLGACDRR